MCRENTTRHQIHIGRGQRTANISANRGTNFTRILIPMARKRTVEEYRPTSDRPTSTVESPEEYRRLADQCRETARTVSAGNGRTNLLAMAEIWDLLADRVGRTP